MSGVAFRRAKQHVRIQSVLNTDLLSLFKIYGKVYLGQTTHLKDATEEEICVMIRAEWRCFGVKKKREKNPPHITKKKTKTTTTKKKQKQVMDQPVLQTMTYGCQIWTLNKQLTIREPLKEQWIGKRQIYSYKIRYQAQRSRKEQR